jgi:hypothetical protein
MASLAELETLSEQLRGEIEESESGLADELKGLEAQSASLQVDIDQGTSITPTGLSAGAAGRAAGWKGLGSSYYTFRAAGNYLIGDKEDAARDLKTAGQLDNQAGRIGQHLVKFDDFVKDVSDSYKGTGENKEAVDLLSEFGELTAYTANQAIPSALDSLAWTLGGFVAGGLTTGGTAAVPGAVGGLVAKGQIKRAVTKAVKAYAKGEGTPEGDMVARDAIKKMAADKARSKFGVAGAKKAGKAGALTSGYIQGTASSFDESMESDIEKKDAAELAFAMGVPFAVMDYLPEMAFYKSVKGLIKGSHIKKGKYLRNLVGGVAKTGAVQGFKELGAEAGQEALMVAQRFIQDPNYDLKSATMRMSEAAFAGLVAGKSLGSTGKLAGNIAGQVRDTAGSVKDILAERRSEAGTEVRLRESPPVNGPTPLLDGPTPRLEDNQTRSAGMASMDGKNLSVLEQAKRRAQLRPENIAQTPLVDLLAVMPTDEDGNPINPNVNTDADAAAAVQELNRRADEMGPNKYMVLMRQALKKLAGKQEAVGDDKTEIEREVFNDTLEQASTLPEAGATEQRTADGEETSQGYEERLIGKNTKGDGYKINSRSINKRMAKLQEENPGRQYRVVQKDGMSFIEEVVESNFDVSEIVNEGVKKAVKGMLAEGADRTLPATDPQGNETTLAPIELTKAGERANNKDKANASNMTYPQLLMSGFLRMNQELAERGFKIDLDSLPRSTILAQKGNTNYTWGELQDAWAERKNTEAGSAFDGEDGRAQRLIKVEEKIENIQAFIEGLDDPDGVVGLEALQMLSDALGNYEALLAEGDAKEDASLETDTTVMGENQNESDANKDRILDEDGKPIIYSAKRGTKPEVSIPGRLDSRRKGKKDSAGKTFAFLREQKRQEEKSEADQKRAKAARAAVNKATKPEPKPTVEKKAKPKVEKKAKPKVEAKTKTGKRTSKNGTTAWGSIPAVFQNYIDAVTKSLGLDSGINLFYYDEMEGLSFPNEVKELFRRQFSEGSAAAVVQFRGKRYIALKKQTGKKDNAYQLAKQVFALGHEIGHIVMWDMWKSLPKVQQARLQKQFDKERLVKKAGVYTYTDDAAGFEEWFADQVSSWAKKQSEKPNDFSQAFFKKVAKQITQIFNRSRQFVRKQLEEGQSDDSRSALRDMKERATLNETFEQFLDGVAGKKPDGSVNFVLVGGPQFVSDNTSQTAPQGAKRPDPKKQELAKYQEFSKDPIAKAIADLIDSKAVAKLAELFSQMWGSDIVSQMLKVTLSADQYARTRLGKNGPAFANLFYKRSQEAGQDGDMLNKQNHAMDKWNAQYGEIIGQDEKHSAKVLAEMQAGVAIKASIDPEMRQKLASFFERFHKDYLKKRLPNIGFVQNYFPVVYNTVAMAENPTAMIAELEKAGLSNREAKAVFAKIMQNEGAFVDQMPLPDSEIPGAKFDSRLQRKLKNMDTKAMQDLGFYKAPEIAIQSYLKQATKHAEYSVVEARAAELIEQMNPQQKTQARKIVMGYMGQLGADINPKWNKFQSYIAALQFATTLLFATVASLTDAGNPIIRAKDMDGFKSAMKTWRGYLSKQSREEQIAFAERIGAASRAAVQDALVASYSSDFMDAGARKWSDKYFTAIGLESWTRMTRVISANMARDFIRTHGKKAAAGDKRSLRYLNELGLTPEMVAKGFDVENDSINLTTPEGQAVQDAILSFVDEAIIRPNAAHRPVWASDPHYMLIWQLKSFFYSFGQVVIGGVVREAKARWKEGDKVGAMMSAGLLFGALMPLAALALQVRELIKGLLGKSVGEEDEGILAYLFDLIDRAGILGPLSIIKSMYDASDYGRSATVSLLGPTAGTIETYFTRDTQDLAKRLIPIYSQL